jgi:preprotein translocase subunit SecA
VDGEAWVHFIINVPNAKELFKRDVDYPLLTDDSGNMIGVGCTDSFTGRVLDGRRWSDGLQQFQGTRGNEIEQNESNYCQSGLSGG